MADDQELRRRLEALQRGYADKLRVRLAQLQAAVARAQTGDTSALAQAASEAHQLHGTAGTYGFAEVSVALGEVERELKEILAGGPRSPLRWERVKLQLGRALASPRMAT